MGWNVNDLTVWMMVAAVKNFVGFCMTAAVAEAIYKIRAREQSRSTALIPSYKL